MDSREIGDTMNYSEAILIFVKACGGIKQVSRNVWQQANQKAWSQFQSELFTWILMMVVRHQNKEESSFISLHFNLISAKT